MKPVLFTPSPISRVLVAFFLIIVLSACSSNSTATSTPAGSSSGSAGNTRANDSSALKLNKTNISVDMGSLRIQSALGFQCPGTGAMKTSIAMDQLVLASSRTTYSQDEVTQMRAYVEGNNNARNFLAGGAEPPPTLRWVLGGATDAIPGTANPGAINPGNPASSYENYSPCGADLLLTNTGNTPIQIPTVGVRLEATPQQNAYQYHLIDACSLGMSYEGDCGPQLGSNGGCYEYFAVIQLGLGEKNTVFSGVPSGDINTECGTLTIVPNDQILLHFQFNLAAKAPKDILYSIMPMLTVITAQGKHLLPLPQLVSTLAFASASQFSCYTLQGTTFVLVQSPVARKNWCI